LSYGKAIGDYRPLLYIYVESPFHGNVFVGDFMPLS